MLRWLFAVGSVVVLAGCTRPQPGIAQLPPPQVSVAEPVVDRVPEYAYATGRTVAIENVNLQARVSGYLLQVGFTDGQEVKKGDVLFKIDPDPYEAKLEQAKADVLRWEASREKAEVDVARSTKLAQSGAVSQEDLDAAIANLKVSTASKAGAEAAVRAAELDLQYTQIVAPFHGRMSKALVTEGNLIAAGVTGGPILATIVRTDKIRVEFDIDENTALRAMAWRRAVHGEDFKIENVREMNVPVEMELSNETNYPWKGILDFADNTVDPTTGTIRLRGEFDNAGAVLIPGLFVRVRIPISDPAERLFIAERALMSDQGDRFVFTLTPDNKAAYRRVVMGMRVAGGLRAVDSGLKAGETIIVDGFQRVRNGIEVTPTKVPMRAFARGRAALLEEGESDDEATLSPATEPPMADKAS